MGAMLAVSVADAQHVSRDPGFRVEWSLDPPRRDAVTVSGYVYNERE